MLISFHKQQGNKRKEFCTKKTYIKYPSITDIESTLGRDLLNSNNLFQCSYGHLILVLIHFKKSLTMGAHYSHLYSSLYIIVILLYIVWFLLRYGSLNRVVSILKVTTFFFFLFTNLLKCKCDILWNMERLSFSIKVTFSAAHQLGWSSFCLKDTGCLKH